MGCPKSRTVLVLCHGDGKISKNAGEPRRKRIKMSLFRKINLEWVTAHLSKMEEALAAFCAAGETPAAEEKFLRPYRISRFSRKGKVWMGFLWWAGVRGLYDLNENEQEIVQGLWDAAGIQRPTWMQHEGMTFMPLLGDDETRAAFAACGMSEKMCKNGFGTSVLVIEEGGLAWTGENTFNDDTAWRGNGLRESYSNP